jgi:alpha-ketoglutarate-dependent taurine dioxygenase
VGSRERGAVRAAWRADTLDDPACWYYALSPQCRGCLEEAARHVPEGGAVTRVRASGAQRALLRESLAPVLQTLKGPRGFAILQGLDLARYTDDGARAVYWLTGQALGEPLEQNVQGTLLYDVRDTGRSVSEGARFSVTNADSSFHTDNSFGDAVLDYVGLLCLRTARSGGVNQLVNGYAVLEELARRHPEALEVLQQPFHVDRRGGVRQGEAPTVRMPVILPEKEGVLFRYLRHWIEVGHEKASEPLTAAQVRALDTLDCVLRQPDLRVTLELQPGQMFWINNRWLLHSRTAFEDHPEPERRRHYVRLWVRAA